MPVVEVTLGSRNFQLMCEEGQEEHIQGLASGLAGRLADLGPSTSASGETLKLVMMALMMQDELNELNNKVETMNANAPDVAAEVDAGVAEAIEAIAQYVETVAERVEKA